MILETKGLKTDTFYIPPFDLKKGEIVILNYRTKVDFFETKMILVNILNGEEKRDDVLIHSDLTFVKHYTESRCRRLFFSMTVGEYLEKNALVTSHFTKKIYEDKWINEKTKVNTLAGTPRRLLCLYATLSQTNNIIFDTAGLDPLGAEKIYNVVKMVAKDGGSAILIESFGDPKNDCTKHIELQWLN